MSELTEFTGTMCALKIVKEVELIGMPKLEKCTLMGAFKGMEIVKMENAGKLEEMEELKAIIEKQMEKKWMWKDVTVTSVSDLESTSCYVRGIFFPSHVCNDSALKVLDMSRFVNLGDFQVYDDSFLHVKLVKLIGLHELKRIVIGSSSFRHASLELKSDGGEMR